MSSIIRYLFFFVVFLIPSVAISANHAINPICTTNGNGTIWGCASSPGGAGAFNAIPASASLVRGDTYYLGDGSYAGRNTFSTATDGVKVITIKKATASDYGGLSGWNSSYGDGQAVLSSGIAITADYFTLDGVTGGGPGSWDRGYGIKIANSSGETNVNLGGTGIGDIKGYNITLRHLELAGSNVDGKGYGIGARYAGNNLTVSYVWMYNIGSCPIGTPPSLTNSSVWEYLYVQSYVVGASHKEIMNQSVAGNPGNTTIRYSLFTDVESTGGLMWDNHGSPSSHLYVYGNVFYRDKAWNYGNGVIAGWTGGGSELFSNVHVYNNTFINVNGSVFYAYYNAGAYNKANNEVYNNIFYNSRSPVYTNAGGDGGEIWNVHDYNHYINSGGTHSETNGTSAASGDPFVDYVNFNFNLKAATTAGIILPAPFNTNPKGGGVTRGADGNWDRGAYEFIGGASKFPEYPIILIK